MPRAQKVGQQIFKELTMADHTKEKEHEHWIHYKVDDEPESTLKHVLTPLEIMNDAGIDPQTNYLEQLVHGEKPISYKDKPNEEIEMKDGMRFISKPTGPMPVS
jgi:hypothetical protein